MTKTFFTLLLLVGIGQLTMAQDMITQGVISMEFTEITADDDAMASQLQMLKGSTVSVTFTPDQTKTSTSIMGGMVETTTIANETETTMLMDMMGQKYLINTLNEELMADKPSTDDIKITYDKTDTKVIMGYDCYKATMNSPSLQGMDVVMYVTEAIKGTPQMIQGFENAKISGFPLLIKVGNPMFAMTMETKSISKEVPADAFTVNETGYTKMTYKEFTEKMGGMAGGLGF